MFRFCQSPGNKFNDLGTLHRYRPCTGSSVTHHWIQLPSPEHIYRSYKAGDSQLGQCQYLGNISGCMAGLSQFSWIQRLGNTWQRAGDRGSRMVKRLSLCFVLHLVHISRPEFWGDRRAHLVPEVVKNVVRKCCSSTCTRSEVSSKQRQYNIGVEPEGSRWISLLVIRMLIC